MAASLGGLSFNNPLYVAPKATTSSSKTKSYYTPPKLTVQQLVSGQAKRGSTTGYLPNTSGKPVSSYYAVPSVTVRKSGGTTTNRQTTSGSSQGSASSSSRGSSRGSSSSSSSYQTPAQRAAAQRAAAQAAAQARAQADYNALKTSTLSSISDLIGNSANQYKSSLLDWQDTYKQKQTGINTEAKNNELTKIQGSRNVLDMVGNGIRSGGVTLNNNNASNSSAQQALADAYGRIGQRQQSQVNNDYALEGNNISQEQADLALAQAQQERHDRESKDFSINDIIQQAGDKLGQLNQSAAYASIPDRVDVEAQKATIRAQALAALQQYDNLMTSHIQANPVSTTEKNYADALTLANAGNQTGGQFNYTSAVPDQIKGTGPFSSSLPIFTYGG